jgi:hypothetical protein
MIGRGVAALHKGVLSTGEVFSGDFSGKRTADTKRYRVPHIIISIDAVLAKDTPFGVSSIRLIPYVSYPPKNPNFGEDNGDSQLKRLRAYLGTGKTYHDAW